LLNKDFNNVMQELHTSVFNFLPKREKVFDFVGVPPLAVSLPVSASSSGPHNIKNGLHTDSAATARPALNSTAGATSNNEIPTCSDSDITICTYLNSAFPSYRRVNNADNTFDPCPSLFTDYDKFPTFKTYYRNTKNENVCYTSGRPDWEPYNWFFSQIRWSQDDSNYSYTFCELAIAAHILTGGATSPSQDLYTKTKCMNLAFKRYFQKRIINDMSYKSFFNPCSNVKTLSSLGSDNLLGIRRAPVFYRRS
jgi:hypothetical protein